MKKISIIIFTALIGYTSLYSQVQTIKNNSSMWWSFDEIKDNKTVELSGNITDSIEGNYKQLKGISGNALLLDGFTTVIDHRTQGFNLSGSFSVEAWIAPAAYPWNWCPVITQMKEESGGYSFEVGPRGELGLKLYAGGNLLSCISDAFAIPLRKWTHIAAVYTNNNGIDLFINGEPSGNYYFQASPDYSNNEKIRIGMNYEAVKPSNQIGDSGNQPYWFSFDGIIDELRFYNYAIKPDSFKMTHANAKPLKDPELQERRMPSGPDTPAPFGAYYTKLKYYDEWDALWPVDSDPDIVVRFDDSDVKIVFWRGTRYSPAWVSETGLWMCDQSVEAWNGEEGCFEHMQDRHCRYSHVRIIENTDARIVVHWRYAPVSAYNNLWRQNEKTGWAVWVDEYYYIYPDQTAIRKVAWKTGSLLYPRQFQETLPLTHPGQLRGDVMEADYLKIANLKGEQQSFYYMENPPKENTKPIPESPNIQQHNFTSENDPFIIFEPGNRMHYINDRDIKLLSRPGSCNHWPVCQAFCDGRRTQAADRPTHFLGFPISDPVINKNDKNRSWYNSLYGMNDKKFEELIPLARSWTKAPELIIEYGNYKSEGYDMSEKAYLITNNNVGKNNDIKFTIEANEESPLYCPAIVISGWGNKNAEVFINGKKASVAKEYKIGYVRDLDGDRLILWINKISVETLEVNLKHIENS